MPPPADASRTPASSFTSPRSANDAVPGSSTDSKLVLVGEHDGPLARHPALQTWFRRDWHIEQVSARTIDGVGTKLLIVLAH